MNKHTGSNFDVFLEEAGIFEKVSAKTHKLQLADIMEEQNIIKSSLAQKIKTSRSQLD